MIPKAIRPTSIGILVICLVLTGCEGTKTVGATYPDNKEACRQWLEQSQESCQKETGILQKRLNDLEKYGEQRGITFQLEGEEYMDHENKKYGYSLDIPKSWGVISPIINSFTYKLNDDMDIIGPYLGSGSDRNGNPILIHTKKLEDYPEYSENDELWLKEYEKAHQDLERFNYVAIDVENDQIEELDQHEKISGEYVITHRFIRGGDSLLVFVYNKNNDTHKHVIDSIRTN